MPCMDGNRGEIGNESGEYPERLQDADVKQEQEKGVENETRLY